MMVKPKKHIIGLFKHMKDYQQAKMHFMKSIEIDTNNNDEGSCKGL